MMVVVGFARMTNSLLVILFRSRASVTFLHSSKNLLMDTFVFSSMCLAMDSAIKQMSMWSWIGGCLKWNMGLVCKSVLLTLKACSIM
jgi:hypothetical protein